MTPKNHLAPPADSKDRPRIEVLQDTDDVTVVKVISVIDSINNTPHEAVVMLNTSGKAAKAGPLESDGMVAVIGLLPDGTVRHRAIAGGTMLHYNATDASAAARKYELKPLEAPAEYRDKR
jgi:hypothetical protein